MKKALIASEIRYRRLFESAKGGILILDAKTGKIIDVNPFLIELLGYSKENFIHKQLWEIGLFKDITANEEKFIELKRKEYVRYDNLPLKTACGRKINVEFVSNVYLADELLSRNYEGAGLGLAISKAYVEMLGGKIWVESDVEKFTTEGLSGKIGSVFYFTIPYNPAQEARNMFAETDDYPADNQLKNLKILIAEDDQLSEMLITVTTKKIAKEVIRAVTGIEAVEACRNHPDIDLILMDIKMPEMDGYEATRQIRKFNSHVRIIAQTAYALAGDRTKAIDAGCNDYIAKPLNPALLIKMITTL